MSVIKARYKIVTPMFIAGADQEDSAELRPPSFKGVLRFWFRATALPHFDNKVEEVASAEGQLFGRQSSGGVDAGKSRFSLKIDHKIKDNQIVKAGERWDGYGLAYLGYGVINRKEKNTRSYIKQGNTFEVTLFLKPDVSDKEKLLLRRSLIALGLFGGLGSRSRKGFGSVNLQSITEDDREVWVQPGTVDELKDRIKNFVKELGFLSKDLPQYSAFSEHTNIAIFSRNADSVKLLDEIGKEMIRYRSYGVDRGGKRILPWGETAQQNFKVDHDRIVNAIKGEKPDALPERIVFGLPQNYRFSSYHFSRGEKVAITPVNANRRASPLFIHIHELSNCSAAVFTLLTSHFLPSGEKIKIAVSGQEDIVFDAKVNYSVILDFIRRFPSKIQVYP
ncbi:MAG TPA: type III-B CRISPR module RAMP protein Cmr1 [Thermoanaerobacterales bacterium]|nr:type III-B CRISPR module RAMP protein Cmr1 [Thermoanaerobacterales bacterium]